jgi:hypothetical protein
MWIQAATQTQKDVSTAEGVERCCMIEMVDTFKHPYKDGWLIHSSIHTRMEGGYIQASIQGWREVFGVLFILKKVHIVAFFLEAFIVIVFSSMS